MARTNNRKNSQAARRRSLSRCEAWIEMSNELLILTGTAASIGFLHTVFGPDHYVPFVVMARANR